MIEHKVTADVQYQRIRALCAPEVENATRHARQPGSASRCRGDREPLTLGFGKQPAGQPDGDASVSDYGWLIDRCELTSQAALPRVCRLQRTDRHDRDDLRKAASFSTGFCQPI